MRIVSYHGDGSQHREWTRAVTTREPWTFIIPPGELVKESSGSTWASDYPVVAFFWPDRYYQVFLLLKSTGEEYYCNIITPPVYQSSSEGEASDSDKTAADSWVQFVDLDLDVYVSQPAHDVQVRQLDRDEFELRKHSYAREWVEQAEAANEELVRLAKSRTGPFSPATAAWWRDHLNGESRNPFRLGLFS